MSGRLEARRADSEETSERLSGKAGRGDEGDEGRATVYYNVQSVCLEDEEQQELLRQDQPSLEIHVQLQLGIERSL